MAAYTKNTPGAPDSGLYTFGDVITDSLGIQWQCIQGGLPGVFSAAPAVLTTAGTAAVADMTVESAVSATVSKVTTTAGGVRRTILTLTAVAQTITNGASEFTGTKLVTFPEGRILVLGVLATLTQTTTSTLATTITTGTAGAISLGSVTASNASLTGTMVDMLPSTAYTSSTTVNVAGTAVSAPLAAAAQFNGTTTAIAMFLNNSIATNSADGTLTITGTIQITWVPLGDY